MLAKHAVQHLAQRRAVQALHAAVQVPPASGGAASVNHLGAHLRRQLHQVHALIQQAPQLLVHGGDCPCKPSI
jgi:hypothetical protein